MILVKTLNLQSGTRKQARRLWKPTTLEPAFITSLKGLSSLGKKCWKCGDNDNLCLALHEGAVLSSFFLGDDKSVTRFTQSTVDHVSLERSFDVQVYHLRALTNSGASLGFYNLLLLFST